MPQFEIVCFCVQVLFVVPSFMLAYLLIKYYIVSEVGSLLKFREELEDDCDRFEEAIAAGVTHRTLPDYILTFAITEWRSGKNNSIIKIFSISSHFSEIFSTLLVIIKLLYVCWARFVFEIHLFLKDIFFQYKLAIILLLLMYFSYIFFERYSFVFLLADEIYMNKFIVVLISLISIYFLQLSLRMQGLAYSEYYTLLLFALLASVMIIEVESLFLFYLLMELQTLCFYLLAIGNRVSIFSVESSLKYFISGAFMSGFFLLGVGYFYGVIGSYSLEDSKVLFMVLSASGLINELTLSNGFSVFLNIGFFLISATLLFKIAAVPFHSWMPDTYEGAPISSTLIFSVVPKFALVFFLLKYFFSFFVLFNGFKDLFLLFGVSSTLVGTLYAINQTRLKRMVLYSSIAQVGFILVGISTQLDNDSFLVLFFVIIYLLTSILIWACIIFLYNFRESLGFIYSEHLRFFLLTSWRKVQNKVLWLLIISLIFFSIGGIPPLVGFISKFAILLRVLTEHIEIVFILLIISSVSVYYYIRILKITFFEPVLLSRFDGFALKGLVNLADYIRWDLLCVLIFLVVYIFIDPALIIDTVS